MIQKLIKYIFPFTLIVGLVAMLVYQLSPQNDMTILTYETTYIGKYSFTYYQFHLDRYLANLNASTDIMQLKALVQDKPTYPTVDWTQGFKTVANFFLYGINWIIYILNYILLAPIKLILYPFNIIFALVGLNTSDQSSIQAFYNVYSLDIPQIPPIK